jgi:hypothetical protein
MVTTMPDLPRGFWSFGKQISKDLAKHGPIALFAFGGLFVYAAVSLLSQNTPIIILFGAIYLIALIYIIKYYKSGVDTKLRLARLELDIVEAFGNTRKESHKRKMMQKVAGARARAGGQISGSAQRELSPPITRPSETSPSGVSPERESLSNFTNGAP